MIETFENEGTEDIFRGRATKAAMKLMPRSLHEIARRKLAILDYATELSMLSIPPGNRLETLRGDRIGQYSIRINGQYRICFCFLDGRATEVEIVDYH